MKKVEINENSETIKKKELNNSCKNDMSEKQEKIENKEAENSYESEDKKKQKAEYYENLKVFINNYNKSQKIRTIFKWIITILLILLILEFVIVINNKIKSYKLNAENDNFKCEKALLIKQSNNYILSTCSLILKNSNISKNVVKEVKLLDGGNLDIPLNLDKEEIKFNKKWVKLDNLQYQIKYYDNGNLVTENLKIDSEYLNK